MGAAQASADDQRFCAAFKCEPLSCDAQPSQFPPQIPDEALNVGPEKPYLMFQATGADVADMVEFTRDLDPTVRTVRLREIMQAYGSGNFLDVAVRNRRFERSCKIADACGWGLEAGDRDRACAYFILLFENIE